MSRFQIISDTHFERKKQFTRHPIKAKHLVLAGDIGNPLKNTYNDYIQFCSDNYETVILIAGNHEYWYNTIENTNYMINNITSKYKNVYFLNNNKLNLNINNKYIKIYGGTMWTSIDKSKFNELMSSDNRFIKNFSYDKRNELFIKAYNDIYHTNYDIIVTHHSPIKDVSHEKFKEIDHLFCNNIPHLLNNTKIWICGHLHSFNIHDKVLLNPMPNEYKEMTVDLD